MSPRLLPALLYSVVLIGLAPFLGEVRGWLSDRLGGSFVAATGVLFVVGAVVLAALALARSDRRWLRATMLAVWLLLLLAQVAGWTRGGAETTAVERLHFLFYSGASVLYYRAFRRREDLSGLVDAFLATVVVSVCDEAVQWLVPVRSADVADIGLNAYSSLAGLALALAIHPPAPGAWRLPARALASSGRLAAVAILVLAAYLDLAHLGHLVDDPEIGSFRSYRTAEELHVVRERRAAEWRRRPLGPPEELGPLEVEDYFRTEAGWHVLRRNQAFHAGEWRTAWHENRILERWYTPFLDQVNSAGRPFRLPEAELRILEREVPIEHRGGYTSPVGREPRHSIWLRPTRAELWLAAVAVAGALWWTGSAALRRP